MIPCEAEWTQVGVRTLAGLPHCELIEAQHFEHNARNFRARINLQHSACHAIARCGTRLSRSSGEADGGARAAKCRWFEDRKSTRLNSSHSQISYAVFCLKKKKNY